MLSQTTPPPTPLSFHAEFPDFHREEVSREEALGAFPGFVHAYRFLHRGRLLFACTKRHT